FFSSRRRHTRFSRDWSSDVCSSDLRHLGDEPPPITEAQLRLVGAPPGLAAVVARALAKDRDQRFATMDELAQAIAAAEDPARVRSEERRGGKDEREARSTRHAKK